MEQSMIILPKKIHEIMVVIGIIIIIIRQNNFTLCLEWVEEIINLYFVDLMAYLNYVEYQVEEV